MTARPEHRGHASDSPLWRLASSTDLPALCELEAVIFGRNAWSQQSLMTELAPGEEAAPRHSVVCESGGDIVGYAFARLGGEETEILRIAVVSGHRRRGLATALLSGVLDAARNRGCVQAILEVETANVAAIACYEALGFAPQHRRQGYYAAGGDALVMAQALASPNPAAELDPEASTQRLTE